VHRCILQQLHADIGVVRLHNLVNEPSAIVGIHQWLVGWFVIQVTTAGH
jgi:hypothetical protein